jgi:hypothetical protein
VSWNRLSSWRNVLLLKLTVIQQEKKGIARFSTLFIKLLPWFTWIQSHLHTLLIKKIQYALIFPFTSSSSMAASPNIYWSKFCMLLIYSMRATCSATHSPWRNYFNNIRKPIAVVIYLCLQLSEHRDHGLESHPKHASFVFFVLSCLGSGLAAAWSPSKESYQPSLRFHSYRINSEIGTGQRV